MSLKIISGLLITNESIIKLVQEGSSADLKEWRGVANKGAVVVKLETAQEECPTSFAIVYKDTVLGLAGVRPTNGDTGGVLWSFFKKLTVTEVKAVIEGFPQILDTAFQCGHSDLYNEIHKDNRLFQELIQKHGGEIHSFNADFNFFIIHKDEVIR